MLLAGKIAGYIAVVVSVMIYQQKTRKGLLLCKASTDVLWIIHYFLLGGYTGAVVTCVALAREVIFFRSDRHSKKRKVILVCFLCISVVSPVLTWGSVFSLFAMSGSLMSIVSFWLGEPKVSRIMAFPISACMLVYGISNGSVAVMINEILVMISSVIGILHYDRKKATSAESAGQGI